MFQEFYGAAALRPFRVLAGTIGDQAFTPIPDCWCNGDISTVAFQSRPRIPAEPRGGCRMTSLYEEKLG